MNKKITKYGKTHKKAKSMVQTLKRRGILERNNVWRFEFKILQSEGFVKIKCFYFSFSCSPPFKQIKISQINT